jgi:transposase
VSLQPEQPQETPLFEVALRPGSAINERLALLRSDGRCAVMCGALVLHVWEEGDRVAERVAMFSVVSSGLATRRDVARAFGLHENTVQRLVRGGLGAVVPAKPGPKRKSKLTPAVLDRIAEASRRGLRAREIAEWLHTEHGVVVSQSSVRWALHQMAGVLEDRSLELEATLTVADAAAVDVEEAVPVPPLAGVEPEMARGDVPVVLPEAEHGRYMGLTLYYPALAGVGLVEAARRSLRLVHGSELFGVRAVGLSLFFLSLLRKPRWSRPSISAGSSSGRWWGVGALPASRRCGASSASWAKPSRPRSSLACWPGTGWITPWWGPPISTSTGTSRSTAASASWRTSTASRCPRW